MLRFKNNINFGLVATRHTGGPHHRPSAIHRPHWPHRHARPHHRSHHWPGAGSQHGPHVAGPNSGTHSGISWSDIDRHSLTSSPVDGSTPSEYGRTPSHSDPSSHIGHPDGSPTPWCHRPWLTPHHPASPDRHSSGCHWRPPDVDGTPDDRSTPASPHHTPASYPTPGLNILEYLLVNILKTTFSLFDQNHTKKG